MSLPLRTWARSHASSSGDGRSKQQRFDDAQILEPFFRARRAALLDSLNLRQRARQLYRFLRFGSIAFGLVFDAVAAHQSQLRRNHIAFLTWERIEHLSLIHDRRHAPPASLISTRCHSAPASRLRM